MGGACDECANHYNAGKPPDQERESFHLAILLEKKNDGATRKARLAGTEPAAFLARMKPKIEELTTLRKWRLLRVI
jgi:hypothetical protein